MITSQHYQGLINKYRANLFIKNKYNLNESDSYPDKAYIIQFKSSSNLKIIEKTEIKADKVISNYGYFCLMTVSYNEQDILYYIKEYI